ncbi:MULTISPECIES: hypothetical protein [Flammeovirga]|uniref:3-oxoacyl-ACP synthase n=1 Tax=Flammeovirga aprica JL-4 TaxID=694437 RepID=A0A7X9NYZ5_9BACT|nr:MULTISPECIES: hypothetical protein [Flammeovirga]KXX71693.1 hypothetical protein AVL50_05315 [Flammeovirga sp. SJP92]NME66516.1 hypothetical protein [Flammeovirga aprica JL-4]
MKDLFITDSIHLSNNKITYRGEDAHFEAEDLKQFLKKVYKSLELSYSKFFKMDLMSKAGVLATEFLVRNNNLIEKYNDDEVGLVFVNKSASLDTDQQHHDTIKEASAYFPSPSIFVYTLPNIVMGEVCIKHKWNGEQQFFIQDTMDLPFLYENVVQTFQSTSTKACIFGWVDCFESQLNVKLVLVEKGSENDTPFALKQLESIF